MNLKADGSYERVYEVTNNSGNPSDSTFAKTHKAGSEDAPITGPDLYGTTPGTWYEEGTYSFKDKVLTMLPEKRVKIAGAGTDNVPDEIKNALETLLENIAALKEALATVQDLLQELSDELKKSYTAQTNSDGKLEVKDGPGAGAPMEPPFNEDIYIERIGKENGITYQIMRYDANNPNDPRNIEGTLSPSEFEIWQAESIREANWSWSKNYDHITYDCLVEVRKRVSTTVVKMYIIQHSPSDSGFELTPGIIWEYKINDHTVSTDIVNEDGRNRHQIPALNVLSNIEGADTNFELKITATYKGISGVVAWERVPLTE
jgi:hypothetical protein